MYQIRDIFLSYRNDGTGDNFATRLKDNLDTLGYSVYLNAHEQTSGSFPEHLRIAIEQCTDFLLILSPQCLSGLIENRDIDWVRTELLYAREREKNIVPILIHTAEMPADKDIMPESLRFLPDLNAIPLPAQYMESPISTLLGLLLSSPSKEAYRDLANGNPAFNVQEDFLNTLESASKGNIQAMFEIGSMYYYGFSSQDTQHGEINYGEAFKWLTKVSEANHDLSPHADILIARMHYSGVVPYETQSFKKAYLHYEKAHSLYSGTYYEKVGFMKSDAVGCTFDYEDVLLFFSSCPNDCPNTLKNNMAKFYINYGLFDKAIEILESMDGVVPDAEYKLGQLYQRGLHRNPPVPDIYRAEHHYQAAAQFNHLDSIHALGLLNFRGTNGYRQNLSQARAYYETAAKKGHRGAQYDYAWMCKFGLGGERDLPSAIHYFDCAAQKGHLQAMSELAILYQEPECRNYQKAFTWAQKAAEAGDPASEFTLGNLYFWGRGCEANIDRAMLYYHRAFNHGIFQAKMMIERIQRLTNQK